MRNVRFSLDDDNNIVVENLETGHTYSFHGYAQAMTPDRPLQEIVAQELLNDLLTFTRWLADPVHAYPSSDVTLR